jgi:hypothetical protein
VPLVDARKLQTPLFQHTILYSMRIVHAQSHNNTHNLSTGFYRRMQPGYVDAAAAASAAVAPPERMCWFCFNLQQRTAGAAGAAAQGAACSQCCAHVNDERVGIKCVPSFGGFGVERQPPNCSKVVQLLACCA